MNQKIRELAEQSGFFPVPDETESDLEYRAENARYEKFAELIILECVNSVMDGTKEGDHYAQRIERNFDNGNGGSLHFGVE